jgi:hypothetical protein
VRATSPQAAEGKNEAPAGTFNLTADDAYLYPGELRWYVTSPKAGDRSPEDQPEPEQVALIEAMQPPPTSIEDARKRLGVKKERAARAYREWKSKHDNANGVADPVAPPQESKEINK